MYIVEIFNNGQKTTMHGEGRSEKLLSGNITKGINAIDTFACTLLPSNPCFDRLHEFKTLIKIYNTNKNRYEFLGRLLYTSPSMSDKGLITKDCTFESYLGFLCDSQQTYEGEKNWTVTGLLSHILDVHNSQIENYKKINLGDVTVTDPNDNLYVGIQRKNTLETIKEKLIDKLGGEIRIREVDGALYLDYLTKIGDDKATEIAVSRNMKSITKEKDPSAYITRLIPLGAKLTIDNTVTDEEGNTTTETTETENRLDITAVNGGRNYIDDEEAIAEYGIHVGYVEFDDVTTPSVLLSRGRAWLEENNKVKIKYAIKALDLSLLNLDIDDFEVGNTYPLRNPLLGIADRARVIKKTIDVCEEVSSTIEVGENFKTLNELVIGSQKSGSDLQAEIVSMKNTLATNKTITDESLKLTSLIEQSIESLLLTVAETYTSKDANEEYKETIATQFSVLKDEILMQFNTTTEQIVEVDGELQTKFAEIYNYISFNDGIIKLGASDSAITLEIENDKISFKKNGTQFGWWDGDNFHTGNIVVEVNERAQFGNFAFVPRADGSLAFLKVGG